MEVQPYKPMNNYLLVVLTGLFAIAAMDKANSYFDTASVFLYLLYLFPSFCLICMLHGVVQFHSNVKIKNGQRPAVIMSFIVSTLVIIGGFHLLNMVFYAIMNGIGRG